MDKGVFKSCTTRRGRSCLLSIGRPSVTDAIRAETITKGGSMSGGVIYPIVIDSRYTVDIDNLQDWARYEHLVSTGELDMVTPGKTRRPMPEKIKLVLCDFDGVITDNRVTDQDGRENGRRFAGRQHESQTDARDRH
ncbi:MAG: hypothetical protein U0X87_16855 [Anaerolineales bacterium]